MTKKKSKREKLGDIYEIPLPNGKNAYARVFKEGIGIYNTFCNSIVELPEEEEYIFHLELYTYSRKELEIVGHRDFENEDDAWPPPSCVVDAITKEGSIYYKGEITSCSYEECKDLQVSSVWDRQQLVDKLMGDDKWDKGIRKPIDINIKK